MPISSFYGAARQILDAYNEQQMSAALQFADRAREFTRQNNVMELIQQQFDQNREQIKNAKENGNAIMGDSMKSLNQTRQTLGQAVG